ncbi:hypothetical protein J7E88_30475 [Streptomyces sp. ISL-10]|uniref:hypothetical protein n=1 Tax=Streptomyces sp. ISL-10 TaxID=2819172 RepID=UPI001BE75D55|nr:hypothetical protein [Streptomyces sp. ISL-10]MBT2369486.1 hypothetical protein [Streptomyces sp. ISL-10]
MTLPALASALLILLSLCYAFVCAAQPFGRCNKCDGLGFQLTHDRKGRPKRGKHCRRCNGHGIRIRRGRHLWNLWARTYRRGTTTPAPKHPAQKG